MARIKVGIVEERALTGLERSPHISARIGGDALVIARPRAEAEAAEGRSGIAVRHDPGPRACLPDPSFQRDSGK
jgi:hypothetical protein